VGRLKGVCWDRQGFGRVLLARPLGWLSRGLVLITHELRSRDCNAAGGRHTLRLFATAMLSGRGQLKATAGGCLFHPQALDADVSSGVGEIPLHGRQARHSVRENISLVLASYIKLTLLVMMSDSG
jgi:hypothetical protein